MPPHSSDLAPGFQSKDAGEIETTQSREEQFVHLDRFARAYAIDVAYGALNTTAHWLIACISFITTWFALRNIDTQSFSQHTQHIVFCTLGYQLLMAEATLSFTRENSWSRALTTKHKRTAHWIVQIVASIFVIYGTTTEIIIRPTNFATTHGITGIVAMIATCISLINGVIAMYSTELRKLVKPSFNKLFHIFFGTMAFVLANVSLIYGFKKRSFTSWAGDTLTLVMIILTIVTTCVVILSPVLNMIRKLRR